MDDVIHFSLQIFGNSSESVEVMCGIPVKDHIFTLVYRHVTCPKCKEIIIKKLEEKIKWQKTEKTQMLKKIKSSTYLYFIFLNGYFIKMKTS